MLVRTQLHTTARETRSPTLNAWIGIFHVDPQYFPAPVGMNLRLA